MTEEHENDWTWDDEDWEEETEEEEVVADSAENTREARRAARRADRAARRAERARRRRLKRDPLGGFFWGLTFIWAGLVLFASYQQLFSLSLSTTSPWALILLGMSALLVLEVILRILIPAFRRPLAGRIVSAVILFIIGLAWITPYGLTLWPLVLVAIGLALILRIVFR